MVAATLELAQATTPLSSFGQAQRAEAHLVAAVADLLLRETAIVRGQSITHRRLLDVEHWIDAHLAEPITIGRLCQVAGVGERCLQKGFEARRGMSPMRFVVERRLAMARRFLTQPGIGPDVTSVALGLGFGHVGRFSRLYREAFGERPSQSRTRRAT
jgi:transcriptional regulator GlxA family with amidase domain